MEEFQFPGLTPWATFSRRPGLCGADQTGGEAAGGNGAWAGGSAAGTVTAVPHSGQTPVALAVRS